MYVKKKLTVIHQMALPSSGPLSFDDIHVEVGGVSGTTCSLNDEDIVILAQNNKGLDWFRGKAKAIIENPDLSGATQNGGTFQTGPYVLLGYSITASSSWGSNEYKPRDAFNKIYSTGPGGGDWASINGGAYPQWIQLSYPQPVIMEKYAVCTNRTTSTGSVPDVWELKGSNDEVSWVTLDSKSGVASSISGLGSNVDGYVVSMNIAYRHFRLYVTPNTVSNAYVAISQILFWHKVLLRPEVYQSPDLGSAPIESGGTTNGPFVLNGYRISCSSHYIGSISDTIYFPVNAFNKTTVDSGDSWHSERGKTYPHWLQIQYPNPTILRLYSITSRNGDPSYIRAPNDWEIQASNDGIAWVTLDKKVGEGASLNSLATTKQYSIPGPYFTAYTYFRMYITDSIDEPVGPNEVAIGNWTLTTSNP